MPITVYPKYIPLEEREMRDTPEIAELRDLVEEHDELMEICMNRRMTREEQKTLDEIIETLNLKEQEQWEGVPGETVEMLASHDDSNIDFPVIRQMLGIKPSEY